MALRTDLPYLDIGARFQEFDNGKEITQYLPGNWTGEVGDILDWECGKFHGRAEILSLTKEEGAIRATIRKIS